MTKMKKIILFMLLITCPLLINAAEETGKSGSVDWVKGRIMAKGFNSIYVNESGEPCDLETGKILSISQARTIAYEKSREKAVINAAELLKKIRIDQDNHFNDLMMKNPQVRQKISLIMRKNARYRETPVDYLNTQCTLEINSGRLIEATSYHFPEEEFPLMDGREISTVYTSLIIDTRGLGISPMLLPLILNEEGLEVYSRNHIIKEEAVRHQAVSYVYDEDSALRHKKAGKKPYYCSALKNVKGCPVVSDEDLKKVYSHDDTIASLKKCRVIFIIDRQNK